MTYINIRTTETLASSYVVTSIQRQTYNLTGRHATNMRINKYKRTQRQRYSETFSLKQQAGITQTWQWPQTSRTCQQLASDSIIKHTT